jgi:hypothetical protein
VFVRSQDAVLITSVLPVVSHGKVAVNIALSVAIWEGVPPRLKLMRLSYVNIRVWLGQAIHWS